MEPGRSDAVTAAQVTQRVAAGVSNLALLASSSHVELQSSHPCHFSKQRHLQMKNKGCKDLHLVRMVGSRPWRFVRPTTLADFLLAEATIPTHLMTNLVCVGGTFH